MGLTTSIAGEMMMMVLVRRKGWQHSMRSTEWSRCFVNPDAASERICVIACVW